MTVNPYRPEPNDQEPADPTALPENVVRFPRQPQAESVPTITDAMETFLATVKAGPSKSTHLTYRSALNRFRRYLESAGLDPATTPTTALPARALEGFVVALRTAIRPNSSGNPRSRMTVNTYLSAVRSFYQHLYADDLGPTDVSRDRAILGAKRVIGRGTSYRPKSIPVDLILTLDAVLTCALPIEGPEAPTLRLQLLRDRALLATLFCTGARRAEVLSLDRADIQNGRSSRAFITGKGDKTRPIFFNDPTLALIREYLAEREDDSPALFLGHHRGHKSQQRLSPQGLGYAVAKWGKVAGVKATPHLFRHAKAADLLDQGARLEDVQAILGHESPTTTEIVYGHRNSKRTEERFHQFSRTADELIAEARARNDELAP